MAFARGLAQTMAPGESVARSRFSQYLSCVDGGWSILFRARGMIVAGFWLMMTPLAPGQAVYFSETNFGAGWIRRIESDGSGLETLLETSHGVRGLEVDAVGQSIYWTDVQSGMIFRAPLSDPSLFDPVVDGLVFPSDVSLDESRDVLAWVDESRGNVSVSNLDGSGQREIISGVLSRALAIDRERGEVYFEDRASGSRGAMKRVMLDGTGLTTIIDDVPTATDLAIDSVHGFIYWGSSAGFGGTGGIYRVRFDGSGFEQVFVSDIFNEDATALTIDEENGTIYFGLIGIDQRTDIYRMGLDGSDPTLIAGGFHLIPHMTFVVPAPAALAPLAIAGLLAARRRR